MMQRYIKPIFVLCCVCMLSGCGAGSINSELPDKTTVPDSSASAVEKESSDESDVTPIDYDLVPYSIDHSTCAFMAPSTFQETSSSVLTESVCLNGESPNDSINLVVYDAWEEAEFETFTEDDLFSLIHYGVTLTEIQYFEEAKLINHSGLNYQAYVGEALSTIRGVTTYIDLLAANCPDTGKMYVFAMRDQEGEYQAYREHLADFLYISENGFVVENGTLSKAPEPELISYTNPVIGYTIHLPETWEKAGKEIESYMQSDLADYSSYDVFVDRSLNTISIAARPLDEMAGSAMLNEQTFYAAMDSAKEIVTGAGGNELVASKSCEINGYAAYQMIIRHTAGATPTTSVSWFILQDDDFQQLMCIAYRYQQEEDAEFAGEILESITFEKDE